MRTAAQWPGASLASCAARMHMSELCCLHADRYVSSFPRVGIVIPNPAIWLLPAFQDFAAGLSTTLSLPNLLPHGAYATPTSDGFLIYLPSGERILDMLPAPDAGQIWQCMVHNAVQHMLRQTFITRCRATQRGLQLWRPVRRPNWSGLWVRRTTSSSFCRPAQTGVLAQGDI